MKGVMVVLSKAAINANLSLLKNQFQEVIELVKTRPDLIPHRPRRPPPVEGPARLGRQFGDRSKITLRRSKRRIDFYAVLARQALAAFEAGLHKAFLLSFAITLLAALISALRPPHRPQDWPGDQPGELSSGKSVSQQANN
jgi:hypothetical protein